MVPNFDEIIDFIDRGTCGKVYLVKHFGEILARKGVRFNSREIKRVTCEVSKLKELQQKNRVEWKDFYIDTDKNAVYIYTKYYKKGNLLKMINEKKEKKEDFSFDVFFFLNILFIGDRKFNNRFI